MAIFSNGSTLDKNKIEKNIKFIFKHAALCGVLNNLHIHLPVCPVEITKNTIQIIFEVLNKYPEECDKYLPTKVIIHQVKLTGRKETHAITNIIRYYNLSTSRVKIKVDGSKYISYSYNNNYAVYIGYTNTDDNIKFPGIYIEFTNDFVVYSKTILNEVIIYGDKNDSKRDELYYEGK